MRYENIYFKFVFVYWLQIDVRAKMDIKNNTCEVGVII